jgi:uncharacterized membrane protein YphA (DoxX/SURF4 family)
VLRGLGLVYLVAFSSLRRQVLGLHGRRGIVPVRDILDALRALTPLARWSAVPSLLWIDASDRTLLGLCRAGQVAGLCLAAGVVPAVAAWAGWALYLSFVSVGSPFLAYQWDALLVEAGFVGALAARGGGPSSFWLALFRLMTFRLHLESGEAKLRSGDRTWRDGFACAYHFRTQPLPTPLAYQAAQLPPAVQRACTAAVLALECAAPLLVLGGRRSRRAALGLLLALQALIAATGNFAFFNLLTGVVTLGLLDGRRGRRAPGPAEELAGELVLLLQIQDLGRRLWPERWPSTRLARLQPWTGPLHLVSSYGLFAVMTRERPEIVIEGSDDGRTWRAYELPFKPGDPRRPLRWVAPHQPRLDWQLWFAALTPDPPPWFDGLVRRLLEGSPDVLALFAANPFPAQPPRFVRALLYLYGMTDPATRRQTGAVWQRRLLGVYCPPASL